MGKPFANELKDLSSIYNWSLNIDISNIINFVKNSQHKTLISIASGGSLSAAYLSSLLHQYSGQLAKPLTPLELIYSKSVIKNSNLLFISASGKNKDILNAFKSTVEYDPESVLGICMREDSKLGSLSKKFPISKVVEYKIPTGKDGFLATNSLLAYFVILSRAYNDYYQITFPDKMEVFDSFKIELDEFIRNLVNINTFTVLYGGWGQPVAIDLESKFTEAALGNVNFADYRNFGHGRHHWMDKNGKSTAIVALVSNEEEDIANKTLSLLPKEINKLIIKTDYSGPLISIDLLWKSFYLVNEIGKIRKIDPGKPGVPDYGSKLYNLNFSSFYEFPKVNTINRKKDLAIIKKAKVSTIDLLSDSELSNWSSEYDTFVKKIRTTEYGAIVFDYDGTLCSKSDNERFYEPSLGIQEAIINLLQTEVIIGVVTGRGKSAREALQSFIPQHYWKNVIVGFYNGADISDLSNMNAPVTQRDADPILQEIFKEVSENNYLSQFICCTLRPNQLTIQSKNEKKIDIYYLIDNLCINKMSGIKIVESSHSIDILSKHITKLNIVQYIKDLLKEKNISTNILCVGDKGQWPGNDFELLSTEYALSVDEVSHNPKTCWNLASVGKRNISATEEYLELIHVNNKKKSFTFKY